jgi:hypothetical protein
MRYVLNATRAVTRAFMSIGALCIAIVALCIRPLKKRSAA